MSRALIEDLCATLAGALVGPDALVAPGLVGDWLAGQLPTRDYDRAFAPPAPLAFGQPPAVKQEPTDATRADSKRDDERRVKRFDVAQHVTSGEMTTSRNVRADGTHVTVFTDEGGDSAAQHQEACHQAAPMATHLLTEHIYGAGALRPRLIDTLARLFLAILLEPVRLVIEIEFSRPVTSDVALAVQRATSAIGAATPDELLETDSLLQAHVAVFVVHWFSGIAELGVRQRLLGNQMLGACLTLLEHKEALFDAAQCCVDEMHVRLAGFRHNARVAARLDRGRLLGAFCCSLVQTMGLERGEFTRDVCVAALDRALVSALAIVQTPAGRRFSSSAAVRAAHAAGSKALRDMPIVATSRPDAALTPAELMHRVVDTIRSKY